MLIELLSLLAGCCLVATATATPNQALTFTQADLTCDRLAANVRPLKYDVHLVFPSLDATFYRGQVNISVEFVKPKLSKLAAMGSKSDIEQKDSTRGLEGVDCDISGAPDEIVLHADDRLRITELEVRSEPHLNFLFNERQKRRHIVELKRDGAKQALVVKLKSPMHAKTKGTISISFEGRLEANKERGVFVASHKTEEGNESKQVIGQLKPTQARTVFPCFDEPRFRAPIWLNVTHEQHLSAYGNSELESLVEEADGTMVTSVFRATASMPLHMMAFVVGQFDVPLELQLSRGAAGAQSQAARTVRLVTPLGLRDSAQFALRVARDSFEWFERYINFRLPLEKLDVIAVPELAGDSSAGYGLVLVRADMLRRGGEMQQPPADEQLTTAVEVAHAVVSQWFGGLVSAAWWSDWWFTEGVAAQFAFRMVRDIYWMRADHFVRRASYIGHRMADRARQVETGARSPPSPRAPLKGNDQIRALVSSFDFHKGAIVAHMLAQHVSEPRYKGALRALVSERANKTFTWLDLAKAISKQSPDTDLDDAIDVVNTFANF